MLQVLQQILWARRLQLVQWLQEVVYINYSISRSFNIEIQIQNKVLHFELLKFTRSGAAAKFDGPPPPIQRPPTPGLVWLHLILLNVSLIAITWWIGPLSKYWHLKIQGLLILDNFNLASLPRHQKMQV